MARDRRRDRRQTLAYNSAIRTLEGTELAACRLLDVSASDARLQTDDPDGVPDRFVLMLDDNGRVTRNCRVVWRTERELGVSFGLKVDTSIRR